MADLVIYDTCTRQYGYNHGEMALQFDQDAISLNTIEPSLYQGKWYNCPPGWERSDIPPMKDVGIIFLGTFKGDMFVPWRPSKMFGVHEYFS